MVDRERSQATVSNRVPVDRLVWQASSCDSSATSRFVPARLVPNFPPESYPRHHESESNYVAACRTAKSVYWNGPRASAWLLPQSCGSRAFRGIRLYLLSVRRPPSEHASDPVT